MARHRKRQANGSAWHRKFDDCWYATIDGKRTKLHDETGHSIKGKDCRKQAGLAIARVKLQIEPTTVAGDVLVATVCDAYLHHLKADACPEHHAMASHWINDFCGYYGALLATDLKKKHVRDWVARHDGWKSDNTKRRAMAIIIAAFNHAVKEDEILDAKTVNSLDAISLRSGLLVKAFGPRHVWVTLVHGSRLPHSRGREFGLRRLTPEPSSGTLPAYTQRS